MRRVRELGLLLSLSGAIIAVAYLFYFFTRGLFGVLDQIMGFLGRGFFANTDIPMALRISIPMVVLGVILVLISGPRGKQKEALRGKWKE